MQCPVMQGALAEALEDGVGVEAAAAARRGIDPVDLVRGTAHVKAYQILANVQGLSAVRVVRSVAEDLRL
jgi:hypothetical protein